MPASLCSCSLVLSSEMPLFSLIFALLLGLWCYRSMHRLSSGFGSSWTLVEDGPSCMGCVCDHNASPFLHCGSSSHLRRWVQYSFFWLQVFKTCISAELGAFLHGRAEQGWKIHPSSCSCWTRSGSLAEGVSSKELAGFFHSGFSGSEGWDQRLP